MGQRLNGKELTRLDCPEVMQGYTDHTVLGLEFYPN